jgi:hypothetical protein
MSPAVPGLGAGFGFRRGESPDYKIAIRAFDLHEFDGCSVNGNAAHRGVDGAAGELSLPDTMSDAMRLSLPLDAMQAVRI